MIVIEPLLCFIKPTIIRIIVVLPAPFGPNNPTTCPCSTEKEALSMICLVPISFDTFSVLVFLSFHPYFLFAIFYFHANSYYYHPTRVLKSQQEKE